MVDDSTIPFPFAFHTAAPSHEPGVKHDGLVAVVLTQVGSVARHLDPAAREVHCSNKAHVKPPPVPWPHSGRSVRHILDRIRVGPVRFAVEDGTNAVALTENGRPR